jgi:hypothetical protein
MALRALGLFKKFFRAESNPKMRFGSIAHNVMHYSGLKGPTLRFKEEVAKRFLPQ